MAYSIRKIKKSLISLILSLSPQAVAKNPEKDFSRKRKCTLFDTVLLLLTMAGHSLRTELDDYFLVQGRELPSKSAFIQQRNKLSSGALQCVFNAFNKAFPFRKTFMGFHLLAADGSDFNIPSLKADKDSFIPYNSNNGGYFQMHLNALFDLLERRYVDADLCPRRKMGENRSFCTMIDRNPIPGRILYLADRGYSCFNTIAHIINAGQYFLIRGKAPFSAASFLTGISFPDTDEFDLSYTFLLSRKSLSKNLVAAGYRHLKPKQNFDFIDPKDKCSVFTMKMRIVKILIKEGEYEYLLTNLPPKFGLKTLKDLYHLRWGIETSFRQLKYNLALSYFHSIKREFIEQEVFARLTMFNFISLITGTIKVSKTKDLKYDYQVSFCDSVYPCRKYLLDLLSPKKLKALLSQRLSPIRPERSFPRNIRSQRLRPLNNRA